MAVMLVLPKQNVQLRVAVVSFIGILYIAKLKSGFDDGLRLWIFVVWAKVVDQLKAAVLYCDKILIATSMALILLNLTASHLALCPHFSCLHSSGFLPDGPYQDLSFAPWAKKPHKKQRDKSGLDKKEGCISLWPKATLSEGQDRPLSLCLPGFHLSSTVHCISWGQSGRAKLVCVCVKPTHL